MFLLTVDLLPALPLGCRQQCLPPRLCCSSVGVAFLSSSVKRSPPSSYPVGRILRYAPRPPCPPPAVFCPCPVSGVLASRSSGWCWAKLGPPPPCLLSSCRCSLISSRACCSPAVSPHPCFWGGDKPAPKTSLTVGTPWAVCSPSPNLLVSWAGGLSSCGVGSSPARRCRKNDCIYIIPAPLQLLWGYVSPNPPTKYNIVTKKATAFSVAILHL